MNDIQLRFLRGLAAAAIPPAIDFTVTYLTGSPVFGPYTPLVVAILLAADKWLRNRSYAAQ